MSAHETTPEQAGFPEPEGIEARMQALYAANSEFLVARFLTWTRGDRQAAEDIMQETMLRAWRHIDTLNPRPTMVRSWLLTVGHRIAIDAQRARSARPRETGTEPFESEPAVAAADDYGRILDRSQVKQALSGLSARHREALVRVYVYDQPVHQVARALGVPEGTIRSRIHYALSALRSSMSAGQWENFARVA